MAIDFPNSPTTGDIHSVSGKQWQWDSEKWIAYGSSLAPDVLKVDSGNNRVGINQTSPAYGLDVTGTARVTGVITASGGVVGNVTGNTSGTSGSTTGNAATATEATNVTVSANNSTDETVYPTFVDGATGAQGIETDTGLTYNPSSGVLSATTFTGAATDSTKLAHTGGTLTGVTLAGAVVGADQLISAPIIKDYSETVHAGGNTGATVTLDETDGNVQSWTLDASCTFTMPSGSGLKPGTSMTLILTQDGSSRTGTFTNVKWAGGTAVTLSTGDDDVDILTFTTFNGGANPVWYGFAAGLDMG
ncbi:MAG: hypothetical protein QF565_06310 [Arenicellales bacterium]|nr:hypothetical protein [Arenicellales bacterium]